MSILQRVKFGPCGKCGTMHPRDELHSLNAKFFSPNDQEEKVPVRLCGDCRSSLQATLEEMRWSNDSMISKEVPLLS